MFNMIRKTNILKMTPSDYAFIRMDDLSTADLKHIARTSDFKSLCGVQGRYVLQEVTSKVISDTTIEKRADNWCNDCIGEYQAVVEPELSALSTPALAK